MQFVQATNFYMNVKPFNVFSYIFAARMHSARTNFSPRYFISFSNILAVYRLMCLYFVCIGDSNTIYNYYIHDYHVRRFDLIVVYLIRIVFILFSSKNIHQFQICLQIIVISSFFTENHYLHHPHHICAVHRQ